MKHLGDYVLSKESFPKLEAVWKEFKKPAFQKLTEQKKFGQVNKTLLKLIEAAPEGVIFIDPGSRFYREDQPRKNSRTFPFQ